MKLTYKGQEYQTREQALVGVTVNTPQNCSVGTSVDSYGNVNFDNTWKNSYPIQIVAITPNYVEAQRDGTYWYFSRYDILSY